MWPLLPDFCCQGVAAQAQTATVRRRRPRRHRKPAVTDASAQRRRPLRRVPIYRSGSVGTRRLSALQSGPNAVRDCTATYVQEYRPSGTVITPRMNCYWRPG